MSKAGKALKAVGWIIRRPALLNRVLTDEDTWRSYVADRYRLSQGLPVIRMDQLFSASKIRLGPMTFLDGGSLPTDMMLLAGLAESIDRCRYFEIGTWRGESVAAVAERAASCHTLHLSDDEMRRMGMHERTIRSHRFFSEELENVIHLRGDSRYFDFASLDHPFDLIFIDGDHHYDFVRSDTEKVFQYLVHEKSIVVWHDYGFHPDQVRYEVMAGILDGVGKRRSGLVYHVAHTKCAVYTGRSHESSPAQFPVEPGEYYRVGLERKKLEK